MGCSGSSVEQAVVAQLPSAPVASAPMASAPVDSAPAAPRVRVAGNDVGKGRGKGIGRHNITAKFQVQLQGRFTDYGPEEDTILKRAFLVGQPHARFNLRGQSYEYNFENMVQKNVNSGKERRIRPPFGMFPPKEPIIPAGPMMVVLVPAGVQDSIEVDDANNPGQKLTVLVPPRARPGQQLAVPLPEKGETVEAAARRQVKWSADSEIAVAAAVAAGVAVAGVILGEHLSGGAIGASVAELPAAAARSWVAGAAVDVGDWAVGAVGDVADGVDGVAGPGFVRRSL